MNKSSSQVITELVTIRDYIRWAASRFAEANLFFGHGTSTPLDDAAALVLHSLHQPYDLSDLYFDAVLTRYERSKVVHLIDRRVNESIPTAYLTHEAVFAGLPFYVDDRVLVPRSPIAELIEEGFAPWVDPEGVLNILDLCTGSGCIAIACAAAFPEAHVDAVDLSEEALEVAKINVERHSLTEQLDLIRSDLLRELKDRKYDVIVSNPPYVCQSEWEQLPAEFHAEPKIGFDGGVSGLDLVIRILVDAKHHLNEQGILIVEVGSSAETLQNRFADVPFYWLEFERGGDGVFLLTAEQLTKYADVFNSAME